MTRGTRGFGNAGTQARTGSQARAGSAARAGTRPRAGTRQNHRDTGAGRAWRVRGSWTGNWEFTRVYHYIVEGSDLADCYNIIQVLTLVDLEVELECALPSLKQWVWPLKFVIAFYRDLLASKPNLRLVSLVISWVARIITGTVHIVSLLIWPWKHIIWKLEVANLTCVFVRSWWVPVWMPDFFQVTLTAAQWFEYRASLFQ
jgi:hypothetical protein